MNPKKKIIILSIIFGTVTMLLVGFVIVPLFRRIKKNIAELIDIKKELVMSEGQTGKFEQFKSAYEKMEPDLDKIDQLFVDPEVPINLIEFWEKMAADCNLSTTIFPTSLKPGKNDPWDSIGFQISLAGSFSDFSKFLEKTESGFYLIEAQSLILNESKEKAAEENKLLGYREMIKANLLVKVFTK